MVYVLAFYHFQSPAIVDIVLDEFKNILTFKSLSPDYLLGLIEPGLTIQTLFIPAADRFESSERSFISGFLVICIVVLVTILVLACIIFAIAWFTNLISHEKLIDMAVEQYNVWVWDRIILSFLINFTF